MMLPGSDATSLLERLWYQSPMDIGAALTGACRLLFTMKADATFALTTLTSAPFVATSCASNEIDDA